MKTSTRSLLRVLALAVLAVAGAASCSWFAEASIAVTTNVTDGFEASFTGDGGNDSETVTWSNTSTTAEVNLDLAPGTTGRATVIMRDADGTIVGDYTVDSEEGAMSVSQVTQVGTAGQWQISISIRRLVGTGGTSIGAN